jgi:hypothetical protein
MITSEIQVFNYIDIRFHAIKVPFIRAACG